MSKFIMGKQFKAVIAKQAEDADAYNKKVMKDSEEFTNAIMNVGSTDHGGAGTGVLVETPAYKKWLATEGKGKIPGGEAQHFHRKELHAEGRRVRP